MDSLPGEKNIKGILFLYRRITLILVRTDKTTRVKHNGRAIRRKSNQIPRRSLSFPECLSTAKSSSMSEVRTEA